MKLLSTGLPEMRIATASDVDALAVRWYCTVGDVYSLIANDELIAWRVGDTWVRPGNIDDPIGQVAAAIPAMLMAA